MSGALGFLICLVIGGLVVAASCVRPLIAVLHLRATAAGVAAHPVLAWLGALRRASGEAAAAGSRVGTSALRLLEIGLKARETLALVAALLRA